jgi:hypothetical protein
MSYNLPPVWVSSYSTCQLISVLWKNQDADCTFTNSRELPLLKGQDKLRLSDAWKATASAGASGARTHFDRPRAFLFAAGVLEATGRVRLVDLDMIPSTTDIFVPATDGDLRLQLLDDQGSTLAEYPIDVHAPHPKETEPASFGVVVPFEEHKEGTVKVVVRKGHAILAEQGIPRGYPQVTALSLAPSRPGTAGKQTLSWTGSDPARLPLQYAVLYSADDGHTWWPVHVGLRQTQVEVDFDTLPAAENGRLKVRASNGGRSTESTLAAPVRVPGKPPQVTIGQPPEGAILDGRLPQRLRGDAFSWEDEPFDDGRAFVWRSDRVGELGSGHWLTTRRLSSGDHTITLEVRDRAGRTATAAVHVTVRGTSTPLPVGQY